MPPSASPFDDLRAGLDRAQHDARTLMRAIGVLLERARDDALRVGADPAGGTPDKRAMLRGALRLRDAQESALTLARTVVRLTSEACVRLGERLDAAAQAPACVSVEELRGLGAAIEDLRATGVAAHQVVTLVEPEMRSIREAIRHLWQDRSADRATTRLLDRLRAAR